MSSGPARRQGTTTSLRDSEERANRGASKHRQFKTRKGEEVVGVGPDQSDVGRKAANILNIVCAPWLGGAASRRLLQAASPSKHRPIAIGTTSHKRVPWLTKVGGELPALPHATPVAHWARWWLRLDSAPDHSSFFELGLAERKAVQQEGADEKEGGPWRRQQHPYLSWVFLRLQTLECGIWLPRCLPGRARCSTSISTRQTVFGGADFAGNDSGELRERPLHLDLAAWAAGLSPNGRLYPLGCNSRRNQAMHRSRLLSSD